MHPQCKAFVSACRGRVWLAALECRACANATQPVERGLADPPPRTRIHTGRGGWTGKMIIVLI